MTPTTFPCCSNNTHKGRFYISLPSRDAPRILTSPALHFEDHNLTSNPLPPSTMPSDPPSMPPHPQIHAEAMLEVFVHRSIRFPGVPLNTETAYGDADRLAILGGKMLQLAYASVLFDQRSLLNAADLEVRSLPTKPNVDMYILKLSSDTGVWSSTGGIRKARRERRPVGDRVSVEGQGPACAGRRPEHPRSTSSLFSLTRFYR